jgi:pyruvate formate lyase activating enzyme
MWQITIDRRKCVACGICVDVCKVGVIDTDDHAYPFFPENCIGCLRCVKDCPEKAIDVEDA